MQLAALALPADPFSFAAVPYAAAMKKEKPWVVAGRTVALI